MKTSNVQKNAEPKTVKLDYPYDRFNLKNKDTSKQKTQTKLIHISGNRMAGKIFFDRVFYSGQRRIIINTLSDAKPLTLSEINQKIKVEKNEIYRNLQILRRSGLVLIQRKGRKAGYKLNCRKTAS